MINSEFPTSTRRSIGCVASLSRLSPPLQDKAVRATPTPGVLRIRCSTVGWLLLMKELLRRRWPQMPHM